MNHSQGYSWQVHCAALLAVCAVLFAAMELTARFLVPRISKIESRTVTEQRAARTIAPAPPARPTLLIVGNSLLDTGINLPAVQQILQPDWQVQRFVVENTAYLDWYYGLSTLLESGAKPTAVGLMLSPRQVVGSSVRGSYSAYRLFSARSTVSAGIRAGFHPTEISGMLTGHFSAYYGLREELRKFVYQRIVPGAASMTAMLLPERPALDVITVKQIDDVGRARLLEFKALCVRYNVRCMLFVPPAYTPTDAQKELVLVGESVGLHAAVFDVGFGQEHLSSDGRWQEYLFDQDHFHYSPDGAIIYSTLIGRALKTAL